MSSLCLPFRYFQSFYYQLFVYVSLACLILFFFAIILCLSPALIIWYLVTSKKDLVFAYHKNRIDAIECDIIRAIDPKCQVKVTWTEVQLSKGDQTSVHAITCIHDSSEPQPLSWKPKLVMLHGVGGSGVIAMHLSGVSKRVIDDFDVHTIDLPGFGLSIAPLRYSVASG